MDAVFREVFSHNLSEAGSTLDAAGYDVLGFKAYLRSEHGYDYHTYADTSGAAFDRLLDAVPANERFWAPLSGEELVDSLQGGGNQTFEPECLLYRQVRGGIEVEEPMAEVDWADELPAFGTYIRYVPDFPDDYFRIGTTNTHPPYTREDAEGRVSDIINVLNKGGFEAETASID